MSIHLGDLPTWLAAIGTVGALAAALWQIRNERVLRLKRERQDEQDRHREQARLVAAVMGPEEPSADHDYALGRTAVDLVNSSPEPVYRLVVAIVAIQGTVPSTIEGWLEWNRGPDHLGRPPGLPLTTASILPSGTHRVWIRGTGWTRVLSGRPSAEVAFTDRAGSYWIRRANGQLEELPEDPIDHYAKLGMHGPWDLQTPERIK